MNGAEGGSPSPSIAWYYVADVATRSSFESVCLVLKRCKGCEQDKSAEEFSKNARLKGGLQARCKECHKSYMRQHYEYNKDYYKTKASKTREGLKEYLRRVKERPCADCNKPYPYYVMDFDHVGTKKFNLSEALWFAGRHMIEEEVANCEVVCSNCHRERTYRRICARKTTG